MAAKNVNYKWYQYLDNQAHTHSIKVSTLIGEDATFGFAAVSAADPILTQRGRSKPRTIAWIDPNTGRMTRTPVGSPTATKWTTAAPTFTNYARDTTTDIVYSMYGKYEERIAGSRVIVSKPEPA